MSWLPLLFNWQTWLVAAFLLGATEMMLGTVLLGGMALGAIVTAIATAIWGPEMAASGFSWAVPLVVWAAGSILGVVIVNALFGRTKAGTDVNEAPYKGDRD